MASKAVVKEALETAKSLIEDAIETQFSSYCIPEREPRRGSRLIYAFYYNDDTIEDVDALNELKAYKSALRKINAALA